MEWLDQVKKLDIRDPVKQIEYIRKEHAVGAYTSARSKGQSQSVKKFAELGALYMLRWHICRANFARMIFCLSYEISYEDCSEIFPKEFVPLFCRSQKIHKIPVEFPREISPRKY